MIDTLEILFTGNQLVPLWHEVGRLDLGYAMCGGECVCRCSVWQGGGVVV